MEGGPYRRHGISIAGFPTPYHPAVPKKEGGDQIDLDFDHLDFDIPQEIPKALEEDTWMYKCALSAAAFNARLAKGRPTSFLDLHTNVEQIAQGSQPSRVLVQVLAEGGQAEHVKGEKLILQNDVVCNAGAADGETADERKWVTVSTSMDPVLYPVALTKSQFQEVVPLYPFRFTQADVGQVYGAGLYVKEERDMASVPEGVELREVHDLPPTLMGAVPYKPAMGITSLTTRKRGRPKKVCFWLWMNGC